MDCIKAICLYLKNYLTDEQFINLFFEYLDDFQICLEESVYFNILFTNFSFKEEKISLITELRNYIKKNHIELYEKINDAYVERMIDSGEHKVLVEILKKLYERKEEIDIDCSTINTQIELIAAIKKELKYPQFCGDNWDAIEDLIYDIVIPERLVFSHWLDLKKKLPEDTVILKKILDKNINNRCIIIYA